ncbi:MAG: hypothetical protein IAF58_01550 [Leptolyngbya sp.]|nr:hypothetical protein [Candidatus Melainabacteria bacterium]
MPFNTTIYDAEAKTERLKKLKALLATTQFDPDFIQRLTLQELHSACDNSTLAALNVFALSCASEPIAAIILQVVQEIIAIEECLQGIDLDSVKSDARYAGSLLEKVRILDTAAKAVKALSDTCVALVENTATLDKAQHMRVAFDDPEKPKQKYAVVKETFHRIKAGVTLNFYIGQYRRIARCNEQGIKVVCGDYGIFFPHAEFGIHFDLVEM